MEHTSITNRGKAVPEGFGDLGHYSEEMVLNGLPVILSFAVYVNTGGS
jgi:hypothetical protein